MIFLFSLSGVAESALRILEKSGYEAYLVGGSVRDFLMGKTPDDTDITTNALPIQIKEAFRDYDTIETGIKHGTVTVVIDKTPVEITTYRTEKGYSDGRHPDEVCFTSDIKADLARRDFTINSIAYNPSVGLVDPFEGYKDIMNCVLRCVGNPSVRFNEDALRILRGLRFSSVLGFEIEEETSAAIHECRHLLRNISAERIYAELSKTICGENIRKILTDYADVFAVPIPEIGRMINFDQKNFHHKFNLLEHTAEVVANTPTVKHLRFAALLHDIAKPICQSFDENSVAHYYRHASIGAHIADEIMLRLKADNLTREAVIKLIKQHDTPIEEKEQIIKRRLHSVGEPLLFDLYELQRADTLGLADEYHSRLQHFDVLKEMTAEIVNERACFTLKDLNINGNDISLIGLSGRQIGNALNYALESVIDGLTENSKDELIRLIKDNADSF